MKPTVVEPTRETPSDAIPLDAYNVERIRRYCAGRESEHQVNCLCDTITALRSALQKDSEARNEAPIPEDAAEWAHAGTSVRSNPFVAEGTSR